MFCMTQGIRHYLRDLRHDSTFRAEASRACISVGLDIIISIASLIQRFRRCEIHIRNIIDIKTLAKGSLDIGCWSEGVVRRLGLKLIAFCRWFWASSLLTPHDWMDSLQVYSGEAWVWYQPMIIADYSLSLQFRKAAARVVKTQFQASFPLPTGRLQL